VWRRVGRLRCDRPHRVVPDLHFAVTVGRRQVDVQLHLWPGCVDFCVYVRSTLGNDRFPGSDVDFHVLCIGLFVHTRRPCCVTRCVRQPEEYNGQYHCAGCCFMEQFKCSQGIRRHVWQL